MNDKTRAAIQQALEVLKEIHPGNMTLMAEEAWNKATTAIREALAEQPAQQEPYCWMSPEGTIYQASDEDVLKGSIPMYLGKPPAQQQ